MKVNCPGCNRSYKVDDHRIPEVGLRMRCPQCSASFLVKKNGETESVASTSIPPPADKGARSSLLPKRPHRPSRPAAQPGAAPSGKAPGLSGTILGQPAASFPAQKSMSPPPAAYPEDAKETADSMFEASELDFGAAGESSGGGIDLPSLDDLSGRRSAVDDDPFSDIDLPQATSGLGAMDISIDLPSTSASPAPGISLGSIPPLGSGFNLSSPPGDALGGAASAGAPAPALAALRDDDPFGDFDLSPPAPSIPPPAPLPAVGPRAGTGAKVGTGTQAYGAADDIFGEADLSAGRPAEASAPGPLPSPSEVSKSRDAFAKTQMLIQPPAQAPQGQLPPLGSSVSQPGHRASDDIDFGGLGIPSPADAVAAPSAAPAPERPAGTTRKQQSGFIDFGEVDLSPPVPSVAPPPPRGGDHDLGGAPTEALGGISGEFDEFPTSAESEPRKDRPPAAKSKAGSGLDLASDPQIDRPMGTVIDEPVPSTGLSKEARKPATTFTGRRKWERQSRRVKVLLLAVLIVVIAAGGSMSFTALGPFGAYALYDLLPKPADAKLIARTAEMIRTAVQNDTASSLTRSQREFGFYLKDLPDSEDVRLLGVYLNNWCQIRLGSDKKAEVEVGKLLGAIDLEESESAFAPLAELAQYVKLNRVKDIPSRLLSQAGNTQDGLALLVLGYLSLGDTQQALARAKKLASLEKSARSGHLLARTLRESGDITAAIKQMEDVIDVYHKHSGVMILLARTLLSIRPLDRNRIIELAGKVIDADEMSALPSERAAAHAVLARLYLRDRNYSQARVQVEKAEPLDPENPELLIVKGELALQDNDYSAAAVAFNKVLGIDEQNLDARLGQAETNQREGDLSEAQQLLNSILPKYPNNSRAHLLMGQVQVALKNNEEAEKEHILATKLDRENLEAYISLSQMYLKTGRDTQAMATLDQASAAVPGSPLINLTLADAHAARGDFASAIIELSKAIDLDPNNVRAHFRMAEMYRKMGSVEDAQLALAEVEKRNPNFPGLALEQGLLMELAGDVKQALAAYKKALAAAPDDLNLKLRVGASSHLVGDETTAEQLLSEVRGADKSSAEANFYLGEVFRVTGRTTEALKLLRRAVELDEAHALYHLRYGMALRDVKDTTGALMQYERAIELEPKMAEAHIRVGEIRLTQGAVRDAISNLEKGLAVDPEFTEAFRIAAEALEQLGDVRAAVVYYRKAAQHDKEDAFLMYRLGVAEVAVSGRKGALGSLEQAVKLAAKIEPAPSWYPSALYELGAAQAATGQRAQAIATFKTYLEIAPEEHIDRAEVRAKLEELGG